MRKKIEVEQNEEEEESEDESIEDIKIKGKKGKNEADKKQKTLQLNYLVSNFNGFLNSKNYRYTKTNFKNENMENYDLPILKRLSNK